MSRTITNPGGAHLSETAFRRYEHILERFLNVFPEPFTFVPTELAPSTVVVGIRNAINAVLTHGYSTALDLDRLREARSVVQILLRGPRVVIASPEGQRAAAVAIVQGTDGPKLLTVFNPSERVLLALSILFSERVMTEPVTLTGTIPPFDPPPGVVLERMPDGTAIML